MSRKPDRKLRPPPMRIVGRRGEWTADVEGRELAVLHNTHRVGARSYVDANRADVAASEKQARLVAALIENDMAVLQRDADAETRARDGFIGIFSYKDLDIGEDGSIRLTFVDRIQ